VKALFRTDASPEIGGGHLMRCRTLATALSAHGWECVFLTTKDAIGFLNGAAFGFPLETLSDDAGAGIAQTAGGGFDLAVVDHYGLDREFETALKAHVGRLAVLDDAPSRPHDCDFLADPTPGRADADYRPLVPDGCRLLLGPQYILLRPEIAELRDRRRDPRATVGRILVTMGASDPPNVTGTVIAALADNLPPGIAVDIIVGPANSHWRDLSALDLPRGAVLHRDPLDMPQLMAAADLAITAAGTTCWEIAFLGLPALTVTLAENQVAVARTVAESGATCDLGPVDGGFGKRLAGALGSLLADPSRRAKMSAAGRTLVDGRGPERMAAALSEAGEMDAHG